MKLDLLSQLQRPLSSGGLLRHSPKKVIYSPKSLPCSEAELRAIVAERPTPFHLYDERGIKASVSRLRAAYDWAPNYQNYFAVKANPNPYILDILKDGGMAVDVSSLPELLMSEAVGFRGDQVLFTSNNTPIGEYRKARELGAIINLDDINQIDVVQQAYDGGFPELISFRYNPGKDIKLDESTNSIGNPVDSKFGVPTADLISAYKTARDRGAGKFGMHTMVVTNERDEHNLIEVARIMFEMAVRLHEETGIRLEFIDLGGGLGIPYRTTEKPADLTEIRRGLQLAYHDIIVKNNLHPIRIITEDGRYVLAPNGYLVTTVRSLKKSYHNFAGLDATSADLLRACVYGLYHYVTVLGKQGQPLIPQRLTGSMCENNDTLTGPKDRLLPALEIGDIVVFHDTGAHGHALGYNYNGKLKHAELLLKTDGSVKQIRRAQTIQDLFETLEYPGV